MTKRDFSSAIWVTSHRIYKNEVTSRIIGRDVWVLEVIRNGQFVEIVGQFTTQKVANEAFEIYMQKVEEYNAKN